MGFLDASGVTTLVADLKGRFSAVGHVHQVSDVTGATTHSSTTCTLGTSGWSGSSKTVSVTGVTSSSVVVVSPAPSSSKAYDDAGIECTSQGSGTLTFTCKTTPSASVTVNVLILS